VPVREFKSVRGRHGKRPGNSATVNIHVRDLSQMFNSLDPSPFWDRDLDRAAAEFIEEEFSEKAAADITSPTRSIEVNETEVNRG
jgi:hypothetical protein